MLAINAQENQRLVPDGDRSQASQYFHAAPDNTRRSWDERPADGNVIQIDVSHVAVLGYN